MPWLSHSFLIMSATLLIAAGGNDKDTKTTPASSGVVATLKGLGAHLVELDDDGEIVTVRFNYVKTLKDADLKHLTGLRKLRTLKLGRTNITDAGLVHLKGLTSLKGVTLVGTQVTDIGLVHLNGLTNLHSLWLQGTRVTDSGVEQLKGMSQLKALMLGGTQITDAGAEHLKALPNLEELSLEGTKVTDVGLQHFKNFSNLKFLSLDGSQVTDASVESLEGLIEKNLKWITIDEGVTDATLEQLARLTKLETLVIGTEPGYYRGNLESNVTDSGLKHLGRMTHLKSLWLYLKDTQITDAGLAHLDGLTNLGVLTMSGTKISDDGLAHLEKLSNLEHLFLDGTKTTDNGMVYLKGMTKLRSLNLSGTKISDDGLAHLKGLTSLKYLNLKGTSVTDEGVNDLKQALSIPTVVSAQQAGTPFWFGHYVALREEVVQQELKLTDEQRENVSALDKEVRNALHGLQGLSVEDRRKKSSEILGKFRASFQKTLTDQQQKRLNQITFQRTGLVHGVIHTGLKLTEDQREKIGEISDELRKATRGLLRQEGGRERLQKMRQDAEAKVKAMLTEEQKKQWATFIGRPFDVSTQETRHSGFEAVIGR